MIIKTNEGFKQLGKTTFKVTEQRTVGYHLPATEDWLH